MDSTILYVGIDVSKLKLDVAITLDGNSTQAAKVVKNELKGYQVLFAWVHKHAHRLNCSSIHFCLESTGIYGDGIADYLYMQTGCTVTVSNPATIKAYGRSLTIRTKTDKIDAALIASYAAKIQPAPTLPKPQELRKLQQLVRYHELLTRKRASERNQLETAREPFIIESIISTIKHYDNQIKQVKNEIDSLFNNNPSYNKMRQLLCSIHGIGNTTADVLISEFQPELGNDKISRKAQTAHSGLSPKQRESGTSVRSRSAICKTGNALLRKALYMPTLSAIGCNPIIKAIMKK